MSSAYIYQAEIWCEECALSIMADLARGYKACAEAEVAEAVERLEKDLEISLDGSPKTVARLVALRTASMTPDIQDESSYDSSEYPKGPYPDGGGEADYAQHCAGCGEALDNPVIGGEVE